MKCRKHSNETQWIALIRQININVLSIGFPLMFMDFPATCDLHAYMTDNSSQDEHAVLCIMVVLHSPRTITVNVNGVDCRVKLNECDEFHYFGDTISKGKKNDHIFHNACLLDVIKHYNLPQNKIPSDTLDSVD
jgi:hypothetical protein